MALIKCIECGSSISSFAEACPHCGCPASHQNVNINQNADTVTEPKNTISLKQQEKWDEILSLFKQKRGQEALEITESILGRNAKTVEIINEILRKKELPIELILKYFPDQCVVNKKPEPSTRPCTVCGRVISSRAESCPHCGNPTGVHVCPSCGSTNTSVITGEEKGLSMFLFRGYSTNTVMSKFKCKDCGHKW